MAAPLLPLVLTGASGLVGRRVVHLLLAEAASAPRAVTLLVRNASAVALPTNLPANWRVIQYDLADPGLLPTAVIPPGAIVLHLAAATGRQATEAMRRVNVEGTRRLAAAAAGAGASHLVLVSSTAAGFANRRWYPYAEAKRAAEAVVRGAGVPVTIVRPTMVFGPGSPVQAGLERLALGRLPIVLGSGGVQVQPIHVDDLAASLMALAAAPPVGDVPVDVGGRDRVTVRELLGRMRVARAHPPRRLWRVPLGVPRLMLAVAEQVLGPRLPVTAGQLASFLNDTIADPHPALARQLPAPRGLDAILSAPPDVTDEIGQEFATFSRYLGTPVPGDRATLAYRRAHPSAAAVAGDRLDRWLVTLARRSPALCALADGYARLARPNGTLRRRLVLALAVLESTPAWHAGYDTALPGSPATAWGSIVGQGIGWVVRTGLAVVVLAPVHLAALAGGSEATDG